MFLVDSHCHLDALDYDSHSLESILTEAKKVNVKHILSVATTLSGYQKLAQWLADYSSISLSCGVHPLNLEDELFDETLFSSLVLDNRVVALGETGLDYYYSKENKHKQQEVFITHIELGKTVKKPLIVHTREAKVDTIALLKEHKAHSGVLHCFTEDIEAARSLLDLGFYISFSGIVTFKNAEQLREVARYVPINRLLLETDAPYLAPVPYRGKMNKPSNVQIIAEYIATLKGISVEELAHMTTQNFTKLFSVEIEDI